jgi:photosystem II stability/assembly factor-like uncharacterized protein
MERKVATEPRPKMQKDAGPGEARRRPGSRQTISRHLVRRRQNGYVVGAFNLIFHTGDGGKSWEPWFDRTDNPKFFNLYAIRPAAGGLYIAGEGGLVLKLDPAAQRFKALTLPYNGSFFGVIDAKAAVLVYGLRGNAYRSEDSGKTWIKVDAGLPATIVGGAKTAQGATLLGDVGGRVVRAATVGRLQKSRSTTHAADRHCRRGRRLALVGPRGVAVTAMVAR